MNVKKGTNSPQTINDINYTGHALDEMQSEGIVPSAVENTVKGSQGVHGKIPGTTAHYDPVNNVTVIINAAGDVVTVSSGNIKQ